MDCTHRNPNRVAHCHFDSVTNRNADLHTDCQPDRHANTDFHLDGKRDPFARRNRHRHAYPQPNPDHHTDPNL
jgi:hypothetical protein